MKNSLETQNITLSVPKTVLGKFKEIAFHRQKSISALMVAMMEEAVAQEEGYRVARDRYLRRMDTWQDLGTHGSPSWRSEDRHER